MIHIGCSKLLTGFEPFGVVLNQFGLHLNHLGFIFKPFGIDLPRQQCIVEPFGVDHLRLSCYVAMYIDSTSEHDATDMYERISIVHEPRQVEMMSKFLDVWYNIEYIFEFTWIDFCIYFWNIKVEYMYHTNVSFQAGDWIIINVLSLTGYLMIKFSIVKPLKVNQ